MQLVAELRSLQGRWGKQSLAKSGSHYESKAVGTQGRGLHCWSPGARVPRRALRRRRSLWSWPRYTWGRKGGGGIPWILSPFTLQSLVCHCLSLSGGQQIQEVGQCSLQMPTCSNSEQCSGRERQGSEGNSPRLAESLTSHHSTQQSLERPPNSPNA